MKNFNFTISDVGIAFALNNFEPFDNGGFSVDKNSKTLEEDLIRFYEDCLEDILVDEFYLLDSILEEIKDSEFLSQYIKNRHEL